MDQALPKHKTARQHTYKAIFLITVFVVIIALTILAFMPLHIEASTKTQKIVAVRSNTPVQLGTTTITGISSVRASTSASVVENTTLTSGLSSTSTQITNTIESKAVGSFINQKYPPLQTESPYTANDFLTTNQLITGAVAGIIILIVSFFALISSKSIRRYVRREIRRLESNFPGASLYDVKKYTERAKIQHLVGIILLFGASGIFIGTLYAQQIKINHPIVFSKESMLRDTWNNYKKTYVDENGRTLDRQRENITTSEGQSYTMLRAVWINDKETFDKSFVWTKLHLQQKDNLFSWLYGIQEDGTMGILTKEGGENTASDADSDIALALILAYSRWGDDIYMIEAKTIIESIWEEEVIIINDKPYFTANNLEKKSNTINALLNPSYFSPYAYRIFAVIDTNHPWLLLVDTSYDVIEKSISLPLDTSKNVGLPPNWILINKQTSELSQAMDSNYGFDAMRIPWRLSMDALWFNEPRAKTTLQKFTFLSKEWSANNKFKIVYAHDGTPVLSGESPAFYGGVIGYFKLLEPNEAEKLYEDKLEILYSPDNLGWRQTMSYYDDNWAWFGIALANDKLPNLASTLTKSGGYNNMLTNVTQLIKNTQ